MSMSVDGLVTGMKTTDTINQLMQVEALPQAALKTKVGVANKVVAAYLSVNSRMLSLVAAAKALGSPDTWSAMKATSNSDAAVVTASPGAAAGSMTFQIEKLAATHTMTFSAGSVASVSDFVTSPVIAGTPAGTTFDIVVPDGTLGATKTLTLTPANASLQAVVAAINGATESLYRASAVQIGAGQYTLQLTAKDGGSAAATAFDSAIAQTGPSLGLNLGTAVVTVQGHDAKLNVGDDPGGGPGGAYSIYSKSNTFTDVLSGVTVTAVKAQAPGDPPVTINVSADVEGIAAKVQALVDNANVALGEIASQSKVKSGEVAAGALVGDSAMRKLSQDILAAVSGGANIDGNLNSFSAVGVGLDRSGMLTFTKNTTVDGTEVIPGFVDAYKADPAKTQKYFDQYTEVDSNDSMGSDGLPNPLSTNSTGKGIEGKFEPGWDRPVGLARRLAEISLIASEGVTRPDNPTAARQGILQGLIQRRTDAISDLNDQVSAWDVRLDLRQKSLQLQFSNLEVAMGKMQEQSKWLAGQLATLS